MKFLKENKLGLTIILVFLVFISMALILDPDVYWHIKAGEWILENGIPQKDPFSYWGGNFIAHEWLFDVGLYSTYSIIGYVGLEILVLLLISAITLFCFHMSQKEHASSFISYVIPLAFIYYYGAGLITARPHLISLALICIEIFLLQNKKYKWFWIFPVFTLLTANIHGGSVPILIVILIIYFINYIYENTKNLDRKILIGFIITAILMTLATLCNPYGLDTVLYGTKLPTVVQDYIKEWHPLVKDSTYIPALFMALIPIACLSYSKKAKLIDVLMLFMGLMLTLVWRRMILIYCCICIIFATKHIDITINDIWSKIKPNIKIKKKFNTKLLKMIFIDVLAIWLIFNVSFLSLTELEANSRISPTIIKNYIEENNIDVENNIMFNHYNFGGYFIFNNYKVFMDGRNDVYLDTFGSPNVLPDYLDIIKVQKNTEELLEKYNIKYFTIYKESDLYDFLIDNNLAKELISDEKYAFLEKVE